MMTTRTLISSHALCEAAHITYRQLDYWVRIGLVTPANGTHGTGIDRRFTPEETARVTLMGTLVKAGLAPATAFLVVQRGEYDDREVFRARLHGHVYVEVFP